MENKSKNQTDKKPIGRSLTRDEIFKLSIIYTTGLGLTMLSGCGVEDSSKKKDQNPA